MSHLLAAERVDFRDLAALLAQGFLRLTQQSRNVAVSADREPQKELDVVATESPHVGRETA